MFAFMLVVIGYIIGYIIGYDIMLIINASRPAYKTVDINETNSKNRE